MIPCTAVIAPSVRTFSLSASPLSCTDMRLTKKLFRAERTRILLSIFCIIFLITTVLTYSHTRSPFFTESSILSDADANRAPAPQSDALQPPVRAPYESRKCGHVVLFTSARHGSTWFIDSVERCRYSNTSQKASNELFASSVFKHTEPWKHNTSKLYTLTGNQVANYVVNNSSVKIFSSTLEKNITGVKELVCKGAKLGIPFVVLRRQPEATFKSLTIALETGVWNAPTGEKNIGNITEMDRFIKYKQGIDRYYGKVDDILKEGGVHDVDVVDYDKIKDLKYIKLERSGCYIRNCNFAV